MVVKVVDRQEKAEAWLHYLGAPDKIKVHSARRRYRSDEPQLIYFWEPHEVQ